MITHRFKRPSTRSETAGGGKLIIKGLPTPMTQRQRDVYLYVRFFWAKFGYSPSYQDIAYGLNLKDRSNIGRIVRVLSGNGLFERQPNSKRSLIPKDNKKGVVRLDRLL